MHTNCFETMPLPYSADTFIVGDAARYGLNWRTTPEGIIVVCATEKARQAFYERYAEWSRNRRADDYLLSLKNA